MAKVAVKKTMAKAKPMTKSMAAHMKMMKEMPMKKMGKMK